MTQVSAAVPISAPASAVWDVLSDFGNISAFNPSVKNSYLLGDAETGISATRRCDLTVLGACMDERVIAWDLGKSYEVEIFDGSRMPMKGAVARLEVLPVTETESRAKMTISYTLPGGFLGRLADRGGIKRQNQRTALRVLDGLKHHVESGETVLAGARLPHAAVVVRI
jgi:uncharacterized membrane protein